MSTEDNQFVGDLSSIPNYLRRWTDDVAGHVNEQVDKAADTFRDVLASASWLPDYARPTPPRYEVPVEIITLSRYEQARAWVSEHKILTGTVVAVLGVIAYKVYRSNRRRHKIRRAQLARNGGRQEVVIVAGSPRLPLTRSLCLDLERRGFIVYVVCSTQDDTSMVRNMSRPDIQPLVVDVNDPPNAGASIERFAQYLQSPHAPVPRTKPIKLSLKSVILIPSLSYQTSPIATITPSAFADLFQNHLLQPILTVQAFLPLLTTRLTSTGEKWTPPKVMVFTPSLISSINPPFHAPEATVCSALSAFTQVLEAELRPLSVPVTHMQLGTFDLAGFTPVKQPHALVHGRTSLEGPGADADATETLLWSDNARHLFGRNFVAQNTSAIAAGRFRGLRGSSLRHLHHAVFDVMDGTITSSSVRVGLGAGVYSFVGQWFPRGLVSCMMGIRMVDELPVWQAGPYGASLDGSDNSDSHDFVAVPGDTESNVWKTA